MTENRVQYSSHITNEETEDLSDQFFVHKWRINNFEALNLDTQIVTGPPFKVNVKGQGERAFWIQISKVENNVNFRVSCSLPTLMSGCWLLREKTPVEYLTLTTKKVVTKYRTFYFKEQSLTPVDGALEMYLHCRFKSHNAIADTTPSLALEMNREDMEFLSNFEIECEGRKFPVHKVVLATHSNVFRAMFTHKNTLENMTNKINIPDMAAETLDCMLQIMYTQKEPEHLTQTDFEALLEASDKYNFHSLNSYCENRLKGCLNWENSARLMLIGLKFNSKDLADQARRVVLKYIHKLIQTKSFEELMRAFPDAFSSESDWNKKRKAPSE